MNLASLVVGLIVLIIMWLSLRSLIKERKTGGCSCGCSSCSGACPHCMTPVNERGESK